MVEIKKVLYWLESILTLLLSTDVDDIAIY